MTGLALLLLGPWELVAIALALAVLLGLPVLAMAAVVWFKRWRRARQGRRSRPAPSPGEAPGP